jgi:acyl-CoA synthetase (AMP-forming)/AMP-acid ligase II
MFNRGVVCAPSSRTVDSILNDCVRHKIEVLPTTPTFLRLLLISGYVPKRIPSSLKLITYGTEMMDQPTLDSLCDALPGVDFRQTYGMSEIGILRVKSESRSSLFMRVGGEGVSTRIVNDELEILSPSRMLGYMNARYPFDATGWYKTGDLVERKGEYIRIVGRRTESINVGGLKFMPSEVERAALTFPNVCFAKASGKSNPLTGHHVELIVEPSDSANLDVADLSQYLKGLLPRHMVPLRITVGKIAVGHRFKRL